jgi:hypothetical protein
MKDQKIILDIINKYSNINIETTSDKLNKKLEEKDLLEEYRVDLENLFQKKKLIKNIINSIKTKKNSILDEEFLNTIFLLNSKELLSKIEAHTEIFLNIIEFKLMDSNLNLVNLINSLNYIKYELQSFNYLKEESFLNFKNMFEKVLLNIISYNLNSISSDLNLYFSNIENVNTTKEQKLTNLNLISNKLNSYNLELIEIIKDKKELIIEKINDIINFCNLFLKDIIFKEYKTNETLNNEKFNSTIPEFNEMYIHLENLINISKKYLSNNIFNQNIFSNKDLEQYYILAKYVCEEIMTASKNKMNLLTKDLILIEDFLKNKDYSF